MRRAPLFAVAALVAALPLTAQQPAAPPRAGSVGFGVILNPAVLLAFDEEDFLSLPGFNNFMVPLRVGERLTIEPEFGIFRYSASSSGSGGSYSSTFSNLRLGVGILASLKARGALQPYAGPRLGIARNSSRSSYSGSTTEYTTKRSDWYASGVLGAQYFFSPHFSLGGEVQVTRTSLGQEETEPPSGGSPTEASTTLISSNGLLMLRWFF